MLLLLVVIGAALRLAHVQVVADSAMARYHLTFAESDMHMFDQWARHILDTGDLLGRATYHPLYAWQKLAAPEERWREWYGAAPVFYKAPLYPYALAGLRRLWGDPLLPMALLQVLASVLAIVPLYAVTERLFGPGPAAAAGFLLAVYAPGIHYDAVLLRGPWIALLALVMTWQLGRVLDQPGAARGLALGLVTGLSLLVNEGFGVVTPLVLGLLALRVRGARRLVTVAGAFLGGLALALLPLVARNLLVGAPPLKLAVTGSVVYAVFNAAGASPFFFEVRPAVFAPVIARSGGDLLATVLECARTHAGPGALLAFYAQKLLGLVVPFENADNVSFYYAALRDPLLSVLPGYGWLFPATCLGLGLAWRRARDLAVLLPMGLSLLAAIVLTLTLSRYRATLAVLMMPLAGLAVARLVEWVRMRRLGALSAGLAGLLLLAAGASVLQSRVVFAGAPAASVLYRPAEFYLEAQDELSRGRPGRALRVLLELAQVNPSARVRVGALGAAATVARGQGQVDEARRLAADVERLAAGDAALLLAAGDTWSALGDRERAGAAWRAALLRRPGADLAAALAARLAPQVPVQ